MRKLAQRMAAVVLACTCMTACSRQPGQEPVVMVEADNAAMNAAIRHAQQTLPEFLALAANPPAGTEGYRLKVAVEENGETEHLWIMPFQATAGGFRGTVENTPQLVGNVRLGQVIEFDRSRISDWGYSRDGKQVGSFTVCVILSRMPKAEADRIRETYGFSC